MAFAHLYSQVTDIKNDITLSEMTEQLTAKELRNAASKIQNILDDNEFLPTDTLKDELSKNITDWLAQAETLDPTSKLPRS